MKDGKQVAIGIADEDDQLAETETHAIRAAASVMRHLGQMLPTRSCVGAEMRRWATELFLAAEERDPAAGGREPELRVL